VFGWASGWTMGEKLFFFAFCIISDLMAAILDFIFSSNLGKKNFSQKLPMSCCFFHWRLVKIYKMNKNINSLDYFQFFIQTTGYRNRIGKKLIDNFFSSVSSATGRCAPVIALISTGKHAEITSSSWKKQ
jgi:hypothetical protein